MAFLSLLYTKHFSGGFTILLTATISFVMSVCLPTHMENLGFYWTDCHDFCCLSILGKSVEKIQV
jgi:hypothetical protein